MSPYCHQIWQVTINKITWIFDHVVTQGHLTNKKSYISTSMRLMVTKLDKVVIHRKNLQPTKSVDPLVTSPGQDVTNEKTSYCNFHKAYGYHTWQEKDHYPQNHITHWSHCHMGTHDKWKIFLHFHKASDHQTWQYTGLW